jgi:MFS transporter, OPA family, glycerol-3-phosphate transporter
VRAPPGGGQAFRRGQWRVLLGVSLCYLLYYTGRQNFGWAVPGLRDELGLTNAQIGWIGGTGLAFYGAGQVVSGYLGDRVGARRLVTLGAFTSCLLNWATSFGRGFWSLLIPWALNGYAQSLGFAPGGRLIASWWDEGERGRAFGIFTFAAGFSSVLTFGAAIWVLGRLSWVWVFRLPVLLLPVGGLVFLWLARERPAPGGAGPPGATARAAPSVREGAREVLGNRRFLVAALGFGFGNWGRLGLLAWVPVHALGHQGTSDPVTAWVTMALPIGMALGALGAGYAADLAFHGDHARLIAWGFALATLTALGLATVPRDARAAGIALLLLTGAFVFGPFASFTALSAELLGVRFVGTGIGVMNAVGYAVAAIGDPVMGLVIDLTGTASVYLVTAAACAAGAACGHLARR